MPEPTTSVVANGTAGDLFVHAASSQAGNVFLQSALAQEGDIYDFGHEVDLDDANPDVFDCSELVQWAAAQAGVEVTDGSWLQYRQVAQQGGVMTVDEALRTPGALLFRFNGDPTAGGRPSSAHVAISLGDGRTIEARGTSYGVGTFDADGRGWTHAGVLPELSGAVLGSPPVIEQIDPYGDSDGDGILDRYEVLIGSDPFNRDTDGDGFVDSVELIDYATDPLDPTDNARDDQLAAMGLEPIGQTGQASQTSTGETASSEGDTGVAGDAAVGAAGQAGGQDTSQQGGEEEPAPDETTGDDQAGGDGAESTTEGEQPADSGGGPTEEQSADQQPSGEQQPEGEEQPAEEQPAGGQEGPAGSDGPGQEGTAPSTTAASIATSEGDGSEDTTSLDLSTETDGLDELVITEDDNPFQSDDSLVTDMTVPENEL